MEIDKKWREICHDMMMWEEFVQYYAYYAHTLARTLSVDVSITEVFGIRYFVNGLVNFSCAKIFFFAMLFPIDNFS